MEKGFTVRCMECNKELLIKQGFEKINNSSNIVISVFGSYPHQSLFITCVECSGNEVEFDI